MLEQARSQLGEVRALLPHTSNELSLFMGLAVTAGICEELLYRGFLIAYAARFLPGWLAVIATALVFGFGHLYQGTSGAIQTGVVGLVMGALYLAIGSVWPLMMAHAIVDIGGGIAGNMMVSR
jgi:membrane protease YdiL (CAAX protease family)